MNELDFIDALSARAERAVAAKEFLGKLKTAGPLKEATRFLPKLTPTQIAVGLTGAAVTGGLAYQAFKPGPGGTPSEDQKFMAGLARSNEAIKDQAERDNRPLTYREDITDKITSIGPRTADVFARHPVKGALVFAPQGAVAALTMLRMVKALR